MTLELTSALLALTVAGLCGLWLTRGQRAVEPVAVASADEWRLAALRHFQEHRDLQRSVVVALATPGAVSGVARYDLADAIGHEVIERPRVDLFV